MAKFTESEKEQIRQCLLEKHGDGSEKRGDGSSASFDCYGEIFLNIESKEDRRLDTTASSQDFWCFTLFEA